MLVLLSPSKTLDFSDDVVIDQYSLPEFLQEAEELVGHIRNYSPDDLAGLMNISEKLAQLNHERFQQFETPFNRENARQALLAYRGDVYDGISLKDYDDQDYDLAQSQVRILTGLFGVLRPLDLIQPYRLEMSTKIQPKRCKNLYEFWKDKITHVLNDALISHQNQSVVNLASNEYFKAIEPKELKGELIHPVFRENKNGQYKTIAIHAKKARGMMTDYMIKNRISDPESLKNFDYAGYHYNEELSRGNEWVFTR